MKTPNYRTLALLLTAGLCAPHAHAALLVPTESQHAFFGIWINADQGNALLVTPAENGYLNVRGQDSASAWQAVCASVTTTEWECVGQGTLFADGRKPFATNSRITLTVNTSGMHLQERWTATWQQERREGAATYQRLAQPQGQPAGTIAEAEADGAAPDADTETPKPTDPNE